jgi:PAS domain S-box-containing protein
MPDLDPKSAGFVERPTEVPEGRSTGLNAGDFSRSDDESRARTYANELTTLIATTSDGYCRFTDEGKFVDANDTYCQMSGYTRAELLEMHIWELEAMLDREQVLERIEQVAKNGFLRFETRHRKNNGELFDVEISASHLAATGEFLLFTRDVTRRKQAEERLKRLNRTLKALSECTETLMRASDEQSMLQQVCDAAVQVAGYREAWVGFAEEDERKTVRPVAQSGCDRDYVESVNVVWADSERGRGPAGTAIRTGKVDVCNDMARDPRFAPWRESVLQHGYRAAIGLPLKGENKTFGVLMIYSTEAGTFDERERSLLEELANNVSYAIMTLRAHQVEKQSKEALIRSQWAVDVERQRLESVLDSVPMMLCLLTPGYDVAFANQAFKKMFGEAGGRKCYEYCYGKKEPCEFCEAFKVLETNAPRDWEVQSKKGRLIHAFDFPFTDTDGSPLILEMDLDITEQRETEDKLKEVSRYTRGLIEISLDPLVTINREGKIADVNQATENVTGISREQLIGSDFSEYFTEPEKAREGYQEAFAHGAVRDYPLAIRHTSGGITDVLYNATVFKNSRGEIAGVFAAARDVTARKQAELAQQESEKALATLAEFVPQLVWMCTPDGLNVYFNHRWVEYTGLPLEECHGTAWSTPYHPDDKQLAWNAWNHAVATGDTYRIECRLRAADGSYRWFLTKGVPLRDENGAIVKWFGTCTDIDDLKKSQEAFCKASSGSTWRKRSAKSRRGSGGSRTVL